MPEPSLIIDGPAIPQRLDIWRPSRRTAAISPLVIQGLTLRPLLNRLDLHDDDPVGREVDQARRVAFSAAVAALDGNTSPLAEALRLQFQTSFLQTTNGTSPGEQASLSSDGLHARAVGAARRALLAMRASGEIGGTPCRRECGGIPSSSAIASCSRGVLKLPAASWPA